MSTERLIELARSDLNQEEIAEIKEMRTTETGKAIMANVLIIVMLFWGFVISGSMSMFWMALGMTAIYVPIKRYPYNLLLGKQNK